ncbi:MULTISPECIES: BlaI/MecI/CopY family transcriptional regulator [Clostridium]|uniref:Penicillinase repressor n=4 Tax=Clostridium TaxID=1485 RepID=D8GM00_CLOLD|nr:MULTISPECIES: BlaI/MecI/CopY family transcriptional regulator [Clostridium]ADK15574.1 transcriptional regulator [Clostridium ljungdahlii DSM 13528]AGY74813.1 BlaI/MecI/CopY family transcriptional regulator [Clostridium autoethanogenum DSM 10061]ALU34991.1 Beta-lactamase repressor protein [Clostridium autoethanogenum DSM 10061]OAA85420.1 Penicillinase repressor [Clostridium ljungdahlii DSM 13528]OAA93942.1 Penicillinase repressor [Clostridium coskatii]
MKETSSISDAELTIMKIIWKNPNITANKIIEQLSDKTKWKPNTVKTLINRLLKKNVIGFNKEGKEYFYYAVVQEESYINAESNSFLNKIFNGSVISMVLNFVDNKKLSKNEIKELKDILNKNRE